MEPVIGNDVVELSKDMVNAAALNSDFYARTFFPKTAKQGTPQFHKEIDDLLDRPEYGQVGIEAFRGSAKTSKLRLYTSKRIAYGISRTILFISDTENHAAKSISWLAKAVEYNNRYSGTYKLRRGGKWTETDIEVIHEGFEHTVRVIGLGITGQVRGINIDDYRPDLIVVDDPENEENTATPEQRNKVSNLFFGAVKNSLVPETENPDAKIVVLQTPLHRDCLIETIRKDPSWETRRYGCFDYEGNSRWQERFTTEKLLREKQSYIQRNQLSIWMREMECRVVSQETSLFKVEWLRYWDFLPEDLIYSMAIDPAPPRTPQAVAKNADTDYQAMMVVGYHPGTRKYFIVEYIEGRDRNPELTAMEFFRLYMKYRPQRLVVETTNYQRVLAWFLRRAMDQRGIYVPVHEVDDKRSKYDKIRQSYSDIASSGRLISNRSHVSFNAQFGDYPDVSHDDILDSGALAIAHGFPGVHIATPIAQLQGSLEALPGNWRASP